MKRLVVAYDQDHGIGVNGDLPWGRDLPADLRHFRALTLGRTVIMGRTTYESVGALPDRENVVVTHRELDDADVIAVSSLRAAYERAQHEPVVIGGATIYRQALDDVDLVHVTEVHARFNDDDTFFPELDDSWHEIERDTHKADEKNKYDFDFVTYRRRA
jgi:dihydrofolate reductase